jgi:ribosomal protein S18 acetylase RimI-like enzyme
VTFQVRELTVEDWPLWRRLRLAALAEAPHAFGSLLADWQGEGDREERWRARLDIPGSYNIVAVPVLGMPTDGPEPEPVGMASGVPTDADDAVELISMWVAPAARGLGVGELLIGAVTDWAARGGARTLRLSVTDGNAAAQRLYRRTGFLPTGELGDLMADGVRRELVMAKRIQ